MAWTSNELGAISPIVEQSLFPRIDYWTYDNSPLHASVVGSSRTDQVEFGRDWVVRKTFKTGLAGTFKPSPTGIARGAVPAPGVGTSISGGQSPNWQIAAASPTGWGAGPRWSVKPGYFEWTTGLCKITGTFTVDLETLRIMRMKGISAIGTPLEHIVDASAENLAHLKCNLFLGDSDFVYTQTTGPALGFKVTLEGCVLGKFSPAANTSLSNNAALAVTLVSGSIHRFRDGQQVDIIGPDPASSTSNKLKILNSDNTNTTGSGIVNPLIVNVTNGLSNTLELVNVGGDTLVITHASMPTGVLVAIVPHGTFIAATTATANNPFEASATGTANGVTNYNAGSWSSGAATADTSCEPTWLPFGLDRIIKSSGSIYGDETGTGGISVARHPIFRSYVRTGVGRALDENYLLQLHARFILGKPRYLHPDQWWLGPGSWVAYSESLDSFMTYERNGAPLNLKNAGVASTSEQEMGGYQAFGRSYTINMDPYIGSGKAYCLVTRDNNWGTHKPPRIQRAGTGASFDPSVEFLNPLLYGGDSIFAAVPNSAGEPTEELRAPLQVTYQYVPDIPSAIRLEGLSESIAAVL